MKSRNRLTLIFSIIFLVLNMTFLSPIVFAQESLNIRVGVYDNAPKIWVEDGIAKGFWADITNYIAHEENWKVDYVECVWSDCLEKLEKNEIDLMVDVSVTASRKEKYDFTTEVVLVSWTELYVVEKSQIQSFLDLRDKKIAVLQGSVNYVGERGIKEVLNNFDIPVIFIEFDSYDEAFEAVRVGQADAAVTNMIFGKANSEKYDLIPTPIMFRPSNINYAIPKGAVLNNQLINTIDTHIAQLKDNPDSLYYTSYSKHIYGVGLEDIGEIDLTNDERAWLSEHKDIRIGVDPAFAPFEFITEDGEYQGIAADHLRLIAKGLGIKLEPEPGLTWTEVVDKTRKQEIDVLVVIGITEERKQYLSYTDSYLSFPRVIITKQRPDISTLEDLATERVAVHKDSSHHGYITEHTSLEPILYGTFQEAMVALSNEEVDAVIGNLAVATHTIQDLKLTNLEISGYVSKEAFPLAMAVRKDWPELVSIFNKALDAIPEHKRVSLASKWIPVEYAPDILPGLEIIEFTEEEKAWLEDHPVIKVSSETDWPPFDFHEGGKPTGFSIDYMNLVADKVGLEIEYVVDSWNNLLEASFDKEIDIMQSIVKTPKRLEHLLFTESYFSAPNVVYVRDDEEARTLDEMLEKRIAVIEGFITHEILIEQYPETELVIVDSTFEGIYAVSLGDADGFIGWIPAVDYAVKTNYITNVIPRLDFEFGESDSLFLAVRNDWPELVAILNKGIDAITSDEYREIRNKWYISKSKFELTKEEKAWLEEHKEIRLGHDISWPPFDFVDDLGEYQGICSDYALGVGNLLNVSIIPRDSEDLPWEEMLQEAKQGKIDLIPCIVKTDEREEYLLFTEPYLILPQVLVTRDDFPLISDFNEMKGKSMAVIKGFALEEFLARDYPEIIQIPADNLEEALQLVSEGKAYGTADTFASLEYTTKKLGIKNLRISTTTPYEIELSFAVRKDWPEMIPILERALGTFSEEDKKNIQDKWTTALVEIKIDWRTVWVYALIISFIAAIIIIFIFIWNRKLAKEIRMRKQAEEALNKTNIKLEELDKLKSTFIATMSHELRTPLNSIIGFTGIILEGIAGEVNEEQKKQMTMVKTSGEHLLNLINDVIDISKIEAGKIEIKIEKFDLSNLVREVAESFKVAVDKKGLKFVLKIPPKFIILSDERRARQIILNLVSNAVKNTDKGEIEISIIKKGILVEISVRDTGIGIKKEDMGKLFKFFSQIPGEKDKPKEGTGLGLYLSAKIVHMLKGKLFAKSQFNKGSTFTLALPLKHKEVKK